MKYIFNILILIFILNIPYVKSNDESMICYNRLGDTSDETLIDMKLDNNDDIIIIGKTDGSYFGPYLSQNYNVYGYGDYNFKNIFISKLKKEDCSKLWSYQYKGFIHGSSESKSMFLDIDSNNNIILKYQEYDKNNKNYKSYIKDFIIKYSSDGSIIYNHEFNFNDIQCQFHTCNSVSYEYEYKNIYVSSMTLDKDDNLILSYTVVLIKNKGSVSTHYTSVNIYITKFNWNKFTLIKFFDSKNNVNSRFYDHTWYDIKKHYKLFTVNNLKIDLNNNIYIIGQTYFQNWFGKANGKQDIVIIKMNINGDILWGKLIGTSEDDIPYNILLNNDNIVFYGYSYGVLYSAIGKFIACLSSNDGHFKWGYSENRKYTIDKKNRLVSFYNYYSNRFFIKYHNIDNYETLKEFSFRTEKLTINSLNKFDVDSRNNIIAGGFNKKSGYGTNQGESLDVFVFKFHGYKEEPSTTTTVTTTNMPSNDKKTTGSTIKTKTGSTIKTKTGSTIKTTTSSTADFSEEIKSEETGPEEENNKNDESGPENIITEKTTIIVKEKEKNNLLITIIIILSVLLVISIITCILIVILKNNNNCILHILCCNIFKVKDDNIVEVKEVQFGSKI